MTMTTESPFPGIVRPRSWTVELPAGMFLLNDNQRLNHWRKSEHTAAIRNATAYAARSARVPSFERIHLFYVIRPSKATRRRDPGNWSPSAKAAIDGLVDAGVVPDDNSTRVLGGDPRLGAAQAKTQMVLVITDLDAMHPDHIALLNPTGDPS